MFQALQGLENFLQTQAKVAVRNDKDHCPLQIKMHALQTAGTAVER